MEPRALVRSVVESPALRRCRRKFLHYFPGGFHDETYDAWERGYKAAAHAEWLRQLGRAQFEKSLRRRQYEEIAARAVSLESRTNLLFSFEKMALRDAVRSPDGASAFARGLYVFLHGEGRPSDRFEEWVATVAALPRKQTRVLTWPVVTVFGFIAQPRRHIFLKPNVTRRAAEACGLNFEYESAPNWDTYAQLLELAGHLRSELADLHPRDFIDIQSFLWVQGSDEYPA
jgi:hypothetical protein